MENRTPHLQAESGVAAIFCAGSMPQKPVDWVGWRSMHGGGEQKRASIKARSHTSFARKYAENERAGNGMLDGPTARDIEDVNSRARPWALWIQKFEKRRDHVKTRCDDGGICG